MTTAMPETDDLSTEDLRVREHVYQRLIELGVDATNAEEAAELRVDWHRVQAHIAKGCSPDLAVEIEL